MPDGDERETTRWGPIPPELAEDIPVREDHAVYALPYYTRDGGDTEILVSNPGLAPVSGTLHVFGEDCRVVGRKAIRRLGPNCTQSFRIRPIQPDFAGHVVLVVSAPVLVHVVYLRRDDLAIVGDSMTGVPELTGWLANERSRTYGFGYRAAPVRGSSAYAGGSVFVSNPNSTPLAIDLVFYHQKCDEAGRERDEIKPGCTAEYPFPPGRFGYGRVQVSAPAVINVLHLAEEDRGGVAAAELLADGDRLAGGVPPRERHDRVLFDDTHGCRPGATGDMGQLETELTNAGLTVSHLTGTLDLPTLEKHDVFVISVPRDYYTQAEETAIVDFVNRGGGLLVCQDYGLTPPLPPSPWTHPTREVLYLFGAADEENMAQDQQHNVSGHPAWIEFDTARNFTTHPIVQPLKQFTTDAVCTLSGGVGWETVAETDDDAAPPRRPVLIARGIGAGRVAAYGDSNTFADHRIGTANNAQLGVRCVEWLLFKI
jgi:hypothetical protein